MQFETVNCIVFLSMVQFAPTTTNEAVLPNTLTLTVIDGDEVITVNWERTEQYLGNHNLPIWFAWKNREPELVPHAMKDFGAFIMYHDVEKSSAVVYSKKMNCLFGIIDTRFYIDCLPLDETKAGKYHYLDGFYVKRRLQNQTDIFHDGPPKPSSFHDMRHVDMAFINAFIDDLPNFDVWNIDSKSSIRSTFHDDRKHDIDYDIVDELRRRKSNTFYAEILIFISNEIVQSHNADQHNLMSIVLYYFVKFNAIDMLFAKLKKDGVIIHFNIAGLVLEAEKFVFPYVYPSGLPQPLLSIDAAQTSYQMGNYITKYEKVFNEDSFDFFYLSTAYSLSIGNQKIHGIANYKVNVYEFRKYRVYRPYGTVVSHELNYGDYAISAHEIAHLFDVDHDSLTKGCSRDCFQCHALLQKIVCYCNNCLRWSEQSRREFKEYVSMNLNRCYLINSPRSLQPYGNPIVTLSPSHQCNCYGYQSHLAPRTYLDSIGPDECQTNLACFNPHQPIDLVIPKPIDGTPCDIHKVCWQNQCRKLSTWTRGKGRRFGAHVNECHEEKMRIEPDNTVA